MNANQFFDSVLYVVCSGWQTMHNNYSAANMYRHHTNTLNWRPL